MKAIRRYWDERAQAYSERRERTEWKMEVDQRIPVLLNVNADHVVLEIGVGPGSLAIHLAKKRQPKIVGLDFSKQFLIPNEKAQKLLQKAKRFDVKERFVDVAIISSIKRKRKLGKHHVF